ncbi:MAG: carbohydrate kinase family protein [Anaerolineae bacterium]|nr:carbohydrate kinase family protein [Anaerolineae bacterium]
MARLVVLAGMVTDLIAMVKLPIMAGASQDARPMQFEAGASANIMILAARLGLDVAALGALGDDPPGRFLLDVLNSEHVDTAGVQIVPGSRSPLTLALIDSDAHQHVFIGNVGIGDSIAFDPVQSASVDAADALYWQGYVLYETQIKPLVEPCLAAMRARQRPVYFDSGPTLRSIPPDRIQWAVRQSTIVRMTEDEIALVAAGLTGEDAYRYLLDQGVEAVIVSHGAAGSTLIARDERVHVAGFAVPVVDTVGAGDSFNAAFLYGLLHHFNRADCLRLGNAAGAAAVQKSGAGRNVPTCAEIKAILRSSSFDLELPC